MSHIFTLFITALISLDALFVGMSLKLQKGFRWRYLFVISTIIMIFSSVAYVVACSLKDFIAFDLSWIVGTIFVFLGIKNLFASDRQKKSVSLLSTILLGIIMSIDAVVATVSLTIDQVQTFLIPVLLTAGHLLFLFVGAFVIHFIRMPPLWQNIISATCLFAVAMLKFTAVF